MKNLIDTLKILTKRKLSEKQMNSAIPQKCALDFEHYISGVRKKASRIHRYTDDKFAWLTTTSSNYLIEKTIKREYDENGLLTGKIISYTPETGASWVTLVYSPPGSFFGKKDKKRSTQ